MIAQQHVQVAKDNLLRQQRLVVLAQEKLAAAKNTVSEYQRTAAVKEAQAAAAIQNSAVAAAAEIQRNGELFLDYSLLTLHSITLSIFQNMRQPSWRPSTGRRRPMDIFPLLGLGSMCHQEVPGRLCYHRSHIFIENC